MSTPTRRQILQTVWPIVLANASTPLLGLTDTAVIGNVGTVAELGAIALGALVFSFVYWGFSFLRMATSGFVAQADGADDPLELRLSVVGPMLAGAVIGVAIIALQWPIEAVSLAILDGGPEVEALTADYLRVRIWGAPAALASYALIGALIGLGASRRLLAVQVAINGLNIALDVVLAGVLGWGAVGVALGTAISEWMGLLIAAGLTLPLLRARHTDAAPFIVWRRVFDRERLRGQLGVHLDIMIRTLALLGGFGWFTDQSARLGEVTLAANHILLQLISFSAFVLDGFAFATEALVGRAKGARDLAAFDGAVRRTSELAALSAVVLGLAVLLAGPLAVAGLTDLAPVREVAAGLLPLAAIYVAVSVAAFQLDGIFIGTTRTRAMRNASVAALLLFLGASALTLPLAGNPGLWWAFIGYVIARALTLGAALPSLRRAVRAGDR